MQGKVIKFKSQINNFKVKDGVVVINLEADVKNVNLDALNDISNAPLMTTLEAAQTELLPVNEGNKNG